MRKLMNRCWDEVARIDAIILLAAALGDHNPPDHLQEFLEEEDDTTLVDCFGKLPEFIKEDRDVSDLVQWLIESGKLGFLVQFATPVMEHKGTMKKYSWGYYNTKWVYADTFDDAIKKGFAWVAAVRKGERANNKHERLDK